MCRPQWSLQLKDYKGDLICSEKCTQPAWSSMGGLLRPFKVVSAHTGCLTAGSQEYCIGGLGPVLRYIMVYAAQGWGGELHMERGGV